MNTHESKGVRQSRGGCCCAGKSSVSSMTPDANNVSDTSLPLQRLQVQGATCGGCVKSVEQTLKSVSGVREASMDLATGIASVIGVVETDHLIQALDRVGYPSAVIS
ncbi:MAG: heavy-metal-associated domain-containing protein [Gammaproteobacteria bacterium]|nr:heavy-metal-associated domain-containing protein [Gammaproteobacteria bacterium]